MKKVCLQKSEKALLSFQVVAVGAAAGGAQSFQDLLRHLPTNTGMAYVYVQHLDGDHNGSLIEMFQHSSKLTVQEAKEASRISPNHVYVVPPNRKMQLVEGRLKLSLGPIKSNSHLPINESFTALADEYGEKAIGILLSGNAPDGTLGLKAIKAAGGITFAQDSSAEFNDMPRNAIAEDVVDLVLSPKRIAEELTKLGEQQEKYQEALREDMRTILEE